MLLVHEFVKLVQNLLLAFVDPLQLRRGVLHVRGDVVRLLLDILLLGVPRRELLAQARLAVFELLQRHQLAVVRELFDLGGFQFALHEGLVPAQGAQSLVEPRRELQAVPH